MHRVMGGGESDTQDYQTHGYQTHGYQGAHFTCRNAV